MRISALKTAMPTRARSARTDWSTRFLVVRKYGKPLIIVDIGTATTFDAIDENGAYQGGADFPGLKVAMEALFLKDLQAAARGHRAPEERHRQDYRAVHAVR